MAKQLKTVFDTATFIKKARKVHGDLYDYSLVAYKNNVEKIKIRCPEHGVFEQSPASHLSGRGCPVHGILNAIKNTRLSFEEFLGRANKKHKNKYYYALVSYKDASTKIVILCSKHGIFKQTPSKHMSGQGCPMCARELPHYNELTTEGFISKARKVHGDKYDYSLVDYKKSFIKIKIICSKHGLFEQTPNNHIMGMKCIKCANEENGRSRRLSTEEFVKRAQEIHGSRYDYSETEYVDSYTKLKIICRKHGYFYMISTCHLADKGCPKCGRWSLLTTAIFIERSKRVHGNKYDYTLVDYVNTRTKVKIICKKHGMFEQRPQSHVKGSGCFLCKESQGEIKISQYLEDNKIVYEREKSFRGCKNLNKLLFDFYIPSLNTCIEFDGIQHYRPIDYFGGESVFKKIKKCDAIKSNFCKESSTNLIRIPYRKLNFIEAILDKELLELKVA